MDPILSALIQLCDYYHHPIVDKVTITDDVDGKTLEEVRDTLKLLYDYYKSENKRTNVLLKRLHLHRDELCFDSRVQLAQMSMWQETFKTKQCTSEAFTLSYLQIRKKKNNLKYSLVRVNNYINTYNDLLVKIFEQLRSSERYLEQCKEEMCDESSDEIESLQVKLEVYKSQIAKNEESYSWLSDKKMSIDYIEWEICSLHYLMNEKKEIETELSHFEGLHPDLFKAAEQALEMENKFKEYWQKLTQYS